VTAGSRVQGDSGFNPVLGFLPVSTAAFDVDKDVAVLFQSRPGFSPCLDLRVYPGSFGGFTGFNPVLGFLTVSTDAIELRQIVQTVSIPSWVFSLSRRLGGIRHRRHDPVSIPSWVFSLSRPNTTTVHQGRTAPFQSRPGFSPCLDIMVAARSGVTRRFQSRPGFSPCLDRRLPVDRPEDGSVSIPSWVFSLPRLRHPYALEDGPPGFNPVLGILPASTKQNGPTDRRTGRVSIPSWVFSLPRPPARIRSVSLRSRFNPVLGFLPASTGDEGRSLVGVGEFQSRPGFSPCLDRTGR